MVKRLNKKILLRVILIAAAAFVLAAVLISIGVGSGSSGHSTPPTLSTTTK